MEITDFKKKSYNEYRDKIKSPLNLCFLQISCKKQRLNYILSFLERLPLTKRTLTLSFFEITGID